MADNHSDISAVRQEIENLFDINFPLIHSISEIREKLTVYFNALINNNLHKLLQLLYRIDIDEKKLRKLLEQEKGSDAAGLIADLVIERQLQKIKSRREFRRQDNDVDENDQW